MTKPSDGRRRVVIEGVKPEIDAGRFPIKRIVGDTVHVEADVFADGHDHVSCRLWFRHQDESEYHFVKMAPLGNDRWEGLFRVERTGQYYYTITGAIDHFDTWHSDLLKRLEAGQDVQLELQTGGILVEQAARRANGKDAIQLTEAARVLRTRSADEDAKVLALDATLAELMERYPDTSLETRYEKELTVTVDRTRARFSSWYEMFPRSCSAEAGAHGTFRDAEGRLPYIAKLGFDVLYLPPIHPIGESFRKGKNNTVTAEPGDVGSPWAIGAEAGGHTAIHPDLGTLEDFRHLIAKAKEAGLEMAMDIAFQCSPDHPWVKEHPQWFKKRADGSIQYAENPPKKYQDIYPFDFECDDFQALWDELLRVTLHWVGHGIKIFRVDNPHTKPFPFWEWLISEVKKRDPDVLFLAEAFTRPKVMNRLGKLGFTQSYTYFTWRNDPYSIREYYTSLTTEPLVDFFRPNAWPNTPDILPTYLQTDARAAHIVRAVLAATLSSNWGVYGPAFELMDTRPAAPGKEEYLDSEKYQTRQWDMNNPNSLSDLLARLNRIRKENQALQRDRGLTFHNVDNGNIVCFSKVWNESRIIVVANTDPYNMQWGNLALNLDAMGLSPHEPFQVHDLLTDARYIWQGWHPVVGLDPGATPVHVLAVRKRVRNESDFDYFV